MNIYEIEANKNREIKTYFVYAANVESAFQKLGESLLGDRLNAGAFWSIVAWKKVCSLPVGAELGAEIFSSLSELVSAIK